MVKRGVATFTLDSGQCPPWLFQRMVKLGREISEVLIDEYGPDEFIQRIADPVWFQSLGTVLAFDWNASGLTTILTAALKEAIRGDEQNLGIFICGGKGKTSKKTPDEILQWGYRLNLPKAQADQLVSNSKMSAKVDSALVQDGYQLYHHSFFFSRSGSWAVVQQGMNTENATARRYHWFDDSQKLDFVNDPHKAISSVSVHENVLNMASKKSEKNRDLSQELIESGYKTLMKDIQILRQHSGAVSRMLTLKTGDEQLTLLQLDNAEFSHHALEMEDFSKSKYLDRILQKVAYEKPESYEKLLATQGVGPKTIRALSLVGEVIYGAKPSYEDPARYSFAHGGKDATPFPVDTKTYDETIEILGNALRKTRINPIDKDKALKRLQTTSNI